MVAWIETDDGIEGWKVLEFLVGGGDVNEVPVREREPDGPISAIEGLEVGIVAIAV